MKYIIAVIQPDRLDDVLDRLTEKEIHLVTVTNVLGRDNVSAGYSFDGVGNLQTVRYGSGVTNLYQYDRLNRLTNAVWKTSVATPVLVGSFYYKLGLTGMRTNLDESLNGTRSYAWKYDALNRLTNENISAIDSWGYGYDPVGNRTNRTSLSGLGNQTPTYNANDWLTTDTYDANGNLVASRSLPRGAGFGVANAYQTPRQVQLQIRFRF